MRKKLFILVSVFVVAGLVFVWRPAAAASPIIIEGNVTFPSGTPAAGQKVAVDCSGQHFSNFIGFVFADSSGHYIIHTDDSLCPAGSFALALADKDGNGVFETAAISPIRPDTVVNLVLGENFTAPEMGLAVSGVAIAAGAVLFWIARRRALSTGGSRA